MENTGLRTRGSRQAFPGTVDGPFSYAAEEEFFFGQFRTLELRNSARIVQS
jgi:hypothetical protein